MADINIGRALSGLGAAFKNEMPAFMQQVRQEDLDAEKRAQREMFNADRLFDRGIAAEDRAMRLAASEATRLAAIDEKRQKTLFIDSKIALDALNAGNLNEVYEKFTDRLNVLPSMGVTNLKLSQDVQRLAAGAFENPDDLLNLRNRLEGYVNTGMSYGVLDKPVVDSFTLGEDQIRFEKNLPVAYGPEKVVPPEKYTSSQYAAARYADRIYNSNLVIDELESNFIDVVSGIAGAIPKANRWKSENRQLIENAELDFVLAVLRDESGAVIGKDEEVAAIKLYMPKTGDSQAVIDQKRNRRNAVSRNMIREASGAYQPRENASRSPAATELDVVVDYDSEGNRI
jgi:hypothetical protein